MAKEDAGNGGMSTSRRQWTIACERKLLHWVNSLPLASCLLVEDLAELRFGDVLWGIIVWIQHGNDVSSTSTSAAMDQESRDVVSRVVDFVAQQCCARDRDVMYIVHSAQCVSRVLEGDMKVIGALLLVLKRLVKELDHQAQSANATAEENHRRAMSQAIARQRTRPVAPRVRMESDKWEAKSLDGNLPQPWTMEHSQPSDGNETRVLSSKICTRAKSQFQSVAKHDENDDTRCNLTPPLQPRVRGRSSKHASTTTKALVCDTSMISRRKVLDWIRSFSSDFTFLTPSPGSGSGSAIHASAMWPQLKDGVVLCALAAAIARRRGSITVRQQLHTVRSGSHSSSGSSPDFAGARSVLFPRGAVLEPHTNAEKKHNLAISWKLLSECNMTKPFVSGAAATAESFVELFFECEDKEDGEVAVWELLENIKKRFHQSTSVRCCQSPIVKPVYTPVEQRGIVSKRPYITAEQIDTVKKWMKAAGVDPNAVSSGILEDSLRNGVALCQLLCQATPRNATKLKFTNPPRTLVQVRENVHRAMAVLAGNSRMPPVYLTTHAAEGIIVGDKQYIYGVLWQFMQFSRDQEARAQLSNEKMESTIHPAPSPLPSPPPPEIGTIANEERVETKPPAIPSRDASIPSAFELDILASELVDESSADCVSWASSCATVPWEEGAVGDDILPMAVESRGKPREPASDDMDIVPHAHGERANPSSLRAVETALAIHNESRVDVDERQPSPERVKTTEIDSSEQREADHIDVRQPVLGSLHRHLLQPKQRPAAAATFTKTQVDHVLQWLRDLGVHVRQPTDLYNADVKLLEFQSGVLLCTIVEKLEHTRSMEGVCRHEKPAKAQVLHNIDKALLILQSKKGIPLHLLRNKWKIYEGDRATILDLLLHTRKAYGYLPKH